MSPEQETKRAGLKISFSQPNMKRSQSQGFAPLTLPAFQQAVNIGKAAEEKSKLLLHKGKHSTGKLKLEEGEFDFQADDLVDHVSFHWCRQSAKMCVAQCIIKFSGRNRQRRVRDRQQDGILGEGSY